MRSSQLEKMTGEICQCWHTVHQPTLSLLCLMAGSGLTENALNSGHCIRYGELRWPKKYLALVKSEPDSSPDHLRCLVIALSHLYCSRCKDNSRVTWLWALTRDQENNQGLEKWWWGNKTCVMQPLPMQDNSSISAIALQTSDCDYSGFRTYRYRWADKKLLTTLHRSQ